MDKGVILAFITGIFSFLSVLGSLYVCLSICIQGYRPCCNNTTNTPSIIHGNIQENHRKFLRHNYIMMIDIIFWMCITDCLHALQMCLIYSPQIFVPTDVWFYDGIDGITCKILSIWGIFTSIMSPIWHILLAYHLLYLLRGGTIASLNKQKKYHFIFAVTV